MKPSYRNKAPIILNSPSHRLKRLERALSYDFSVNVLLALGFFPVIFHAVVLLVMVFGIPYMLYTFWMEKMYVWIGLFLLMVVCPFAFGLFYEFEDSMFTVILNFSVVGLLFLFLHLLKISLPSIMYD